MPLDEARKNEEIISLADSQVLRWIDEINGITDADSKARSIKGKIKEIKKDNSSLENKREIRRLYKELDQIQFKPDYDRRIQASREGNDGKSRYDIPSVKR